eukprot:TRINITY_DN3307_c0_g1_i1.p1 TRINITY_DN3307_c0_g1~~TRINITY_DN3307_c0_g1_i1.p1  ORF type:complete len:659 (+),score=113.90 TRINITY_DN3307_c0_g1_i1:142-2118(+)
MSTVLPYKVLKVEPSEDDAYPAEAVKDARGHTMWSTNGPVKKAVLDVVFPRSALLNEVSLVNNGAAFVEVLVCTDASMGSLEPLVSIQALRSSQDVRTDGNRSAKRSFDRSKMHILNRDLKWKALRVVLTQPFSPMCPIGLSSLSFRDLGTEVVEPEAGIVKSDSVVMLPIDLTDDEDDESVNEKPLENLRSLTTVRASETTPDKTAGKVPANLTKAQQQRFMNPSPKADPIPDVGGPATPPKKVKNDAGRMLSPPQKKFVGVPMTFPEDDEVEDLLSNSPGKQKEKPKKAAKPSATGVGDVLKGVAVVLSGFQNPQRSELRNLALELGAKYYNEWKEGGTHLVCAFRNTPKHQEVMKSGKGWVVTKDWLHDCKAQMRQLPPQKYKLPQEDSESSSDSSSITGSSESGDEDLYDGSSSETSVASDDESLFSSGDESSSEDKKKKKKKKAKEPPAKKKPVKKEVKKPPMAPLPQPNFDEDEGEDVAVKVGEKRGLGVGGGGVSKKLKIDDSDSQKTEEVTPSELEAGLKILENAAKGMEPSDLRVDTLVVNTSHSSVSSNAPPPPPPPLPPKLKPLPSFLKGIVIYTPPAIPIPELRTLRKRVVTSGGKVSSDAAACTHVITPAYDATLPKGPRQVTPAWLTDCEAGQRIMPASKYKPV